jgi:hypothetical protein
MKTRLVLALVIALSSATADCHRNIAHPFTSLTSIDPLRAAFNADRGKVRIVMLVSPS